MAAALGFVLPGVFGAGGTLALFTAKGALTLAGIGVNIGGALLLTAATRQTPELAKPENIKVNTKSEVGPRVGHYGVVRAGGNAVFHRAGGGVSIRVFVHGHGKITQVLKTFLDGEETPLQPDGNVVTNFPRYVVKNRGAGRQSRLQVFSRLGNVPSAAYTDKIDFYSDWTANHRLDGLWTSMVVAIAPSQAKFRSAFPKGEPSIQLLAETAAVHDPRTDSTAFSENAALIIADYVASVDGFNRPDAFDVGDVIAQADICDQDMALSTGGSEKRYRLGGSYLLNEKPQEVLQRMLDACAGRVRLKPSGKLQLKVGAWQVPEFTIRYSDILEVPEINSGPDLLDRYNQLPARFTSHDLDHSEVDAEPWRDDARIAEDGETLVGPEKSLLMAPSHRQARAVMKIAMERDNPRQIVELVCKPRAFPAMYEDVVALDVPELGLVGNYEVTRFNLSMEKGLLKAVGLSLRKIDPGAFSLALAEQGLVQTKSAPVPSAGIPVPQNVSAAGAGIQTAANSFAAGIAVSWEAPDSDALTPVLEFSEAGADTWQYVEIAEGVTTVQIPGLVDGLAYDLTLSFVTPGGAVGEPVLLENIVAAAAVDLPLAPTVLAVSDLGDSTALVEMTSSASASLWKTEIYRDAVLVGTVYSAPGAAIAFIDDCGAGTFDWTARSVNVSNKASASDAGPVTETIA